MDREQKEATAKALAALEDQRMKVNAGIAALRSLLDLPPENGVQQLALANQPGDKKQAIYSVTLDAPGPYAEMSVAKAIETYLRAVGRQQTTPQIAVALKKGGIVSGSAKFTNTVYSRLFTLRRKGLVERRPGGHWSLSEWKQRSA